MLWYKIAGYEILPPIDPEQFPPREKEGLEGPFRMRNGRVLYYDPKGQTEKGGPTGLYYDPLTDMYLSAEEMRDMDQPRPSNAGPEDTKGA